MMRDSLPVPRFRVPPFVASTVLLLVAIVSPLVTSAGAQRRSEPILHYDAAPLLLVSTSFAAPRDASLRSSSAASGPVLDTARRIASRRQHVTIGAAIGALAALAIVDRGNDDDGPGSLTDLWAMVPGALAGGFLGLLVHGIRQGDSPR
jgi:hypothetical protein